MVEGKNRISRGDTSPLENLNSTNKNFNIGVVVSIIDKENLIWVMK